MTLLDPYVTRTRIAYFSMEIALQPDMHTYAGGLGGLAGDTARSAADLNLPMVFVTLISREGYGRQEVDAGGKQIDAPDPWDPAAHATPLNAMIAVEVEGRAVWIRPWLYVLTCPLGHELPVILLDTDLEQNEASDRRITSRLYGGDADLRLKQEIVLGLGGEQILQALGFEIETYHLNEGHAALLTLAILKRYPRLPSPELKENVHYDTDRVRDACVFTTHTPVEAGHDQFPYEKVERYLGDFMRAEQIKLLGGQDALNMTHLALNLSGYVNGVAVRHAETARGMFPGYSIAAITNGVHVATWAHPAMARLFQRIAPNWGHDPAQLANADTLPDADIWQAHREAKSDLVSEIQHRTGVRLQLDVPLLVFARRMTAYKRPGLILSDPDRLRRIARERPFQLVFAGKAHPKDEGGKAIIRQIQERIRELEGSVPMVFLPGYDMELAKVLTAGADVWLNTPLPPMEASGTSGMKAAINGSLNMSVLDGWWLEACVEGVTGWSIGSDDGRSEDDADDLYRKLENEVLPLYYEDRAAWVATMKQSIGKVAPRFSSQRMMHRYVSEAYLR